MPNPLIALEPWSLGALDWVDGKPGYLQLAPLSVPVTVVIELDKRSRLPPIRGCTHHQAISLLGQ